MSGAAEIRVNGAAGDPMVATEPPKPGSDAWVAQYLGTDLEWWAKACAQPDPKKRPAIAEGQPQCGYYRLRSGPYDPWVPAAIWRGKDDLLASRGFRPNVERIELDEVKRRWPWIAKNPIFYEEYKEGLETGAFPNSSAFGDNGPPDDHGELREMIDKLVGEASEWFEPYLQKDKGRDVIVLPDEAAATAAKVKRDDLMTAFNRSDALRKAESDPHHKKWTEANERWAFGKKAKESADTLFKAMKDWGTREQKRRDDAAKAALAKGAPLDEVSSAPVRLTGGSKAAVRISTEKVMLVVDYEKALAHLKDRPEIKQAVSDLVQQLYKRGVDDIPGTKVDKVAA